MLLNFLEWNSHCLLELYKWELGLSYHLSFETILVFSISFLPAIVLLVNNPVRVYQLKYVVFCVFQCNITCFFGCYHITLACLAQPSTRIGKDLLSVIHYKANSQFRYRNYGTSARYKETNLRAHTPIWISIDFNLNTDVLSQRLSLSSASIICTSYLLPLGIMLEIA